MLWHCYDITDGQTVRWTFFDFDIICLKEVRVPLSIWAKPLQLFNGLAHNWLQVFIQCWYWCFVLGISPRFLFKCVLKRCALKMYNNHIGHNCLQVFISDALHKRTKSNFQRASLVFLLLSILDQKEQEVTTKQRFSPSSFHSVRKEQPSFSRSFLSRFYGCGQTYDQAARICNKNGGRLFLPRSDDENSQVGEGINNEKHLIFSQTPILSVWLNNKLAKLRRHASRVHFTKIHFG